MLYAGRRQQSRVLVLLFAFWVLSPFAAGVLASVLSRRWSVILRATLNVVMLVSDRLLVIYGAVAFGHLNVNRIDICRRRVRIMVADGSVVPELLQPVTGVPD